MSTKSLPAETVDTFFGFYLRRLYESERGNELLDLLIKNEELPYLEIVKKQIGIKKKDIPWIGFRVWAKVKSRFDELCLN